ncbi:hypothetical protein BLNAU_21431 [Blattamonas nauphoetae]|uniref:Uncharacterized protein n=1 Tax=Blattamonas nauphoetae TaxID=2049346 RepID=A0ABQ9WVW3_9EUKA|nr:hypothetical protein BLNAU_21431 [Blattamonas nauphoetae]
MTRREERGRRNQEAMRGSEHKEQARREEMEFPQSEDVNIVAVSSLLSSLSSLSLSMTTTKTAMSAELGEFSAFVREWEAEDWDLGNEADNTELEALMGVLQEEMRKTEELDYVVADAEYSKCVPLLSAILSSHLSPPFSLPISLLHSLFPSLSAILSSHLSPPFSLPISLLHSLRTLSLRLSCLEEQNRSLDSWIMSISLTMLRYCSALLNWTEAKQTSDRELAVIFRSLVATLKLQPALDVALEAKAVRLLKSIHQWTHPSINDFINVFGRTTDESSTNFVQSIVVLISSPSQAIIEAAMMMIGTLAMFSSTKVQLALANADLIPQLIHNLNPLSLSFTEAVDIHTNLMKTINRTVWPGTPDDLTRIGIEDGNEQQAVHETVLQRVIVPSEKYICHLCMNRFG